MMTSKKSNSDMLGERKKVVDKLSWDIVFGESAVMLLPGTLDRVAKVVGDGFDAGVKYIETCNTQNNIETTCEISETIQYTKDMADVAKKQLAGAVSAINTVFKGKPYGDMTEKELRNAVLDIEIEMAESKLELAKILKCLVNAQEEN